MIVHNYHSIYVEIHEANVAGATHGIQSGKVGPLQS